MKRKRRGAALGSFKTFVSTTVNSLCIFGSDALRPPVSPPSPQTDDKDHDQHQHRTQLRSTDQPVFGGSKVKLKADKPPEIRSWTR